MRNLKNVKKKFINPYVLVIISIFIIFNLILYFFDKRVLPSVIQISETMVDAQATDIISKSTQELFDNEFDYNEMVIIEKDKDQKINLIRVNTIKLNSLTSKLSLKCNGELQKMGESGIDVPLGWMTEKSIYYNLGPKVNFKIQPIGNISTKYESKFESAGINQTRHSIILNVEAKVRIIIPMNSKEVLVKVQVPVAENIIVGNIPNTAIDISK